LKITTTTTVGETVLSAEEAASRTRIHDLEACLLGVIDRATTDTADALTVVETLIALNNVTTVCLKDLYLVEEEDPE
jgi:hypothetical protein